MGDTSKAVEVVLHPEGVVTVRHMREPHSAVLFFSPEEWAVFLAEVREGGFDYTRLHPEAAGDGSDGGARARASDAPVARVEPSQVSR